MLPVDFEPRFPIEFHSTRLHRVLSVRSQLNQLMDYYCTTRVRFVLCVSVVEPELKEPVTVNV
jgi:hypothetical protein